MSRCSGGRSQRAARASLAALLLGIGCGDTSSQAPIEGLSGRVFCSDDSGAPRWDFQWAARGPASDAGAVVYAETEALPNPDGYALSLDGRDGDRFIEWSTVVPGTAEDELPRAGDVPFSCAALDVVVVTYCADDIQTGAASCWVCGAARETAPPGGADGWLGCG